MDFLNLLVFAVHVISSSQQAVSFNLTRSDDEGEA